MLSVQIAILRVYRDLFYFIVYLRFILISLLVCMRACTECGIKLQGFHCFGVEKNADQGRGGGKGAVSVGKFCIEVAD